MPKEYTVLTFNNNSRQPGGIWNRRGEEVCSGNDLEHELNELGSDGWEVATSHSGQIILERERVDLGEEKQEMEGDDPEKPEGTPTRRRNAR